jgi:hypothetical protein
MEAKNSHRELNSGEIMRARRFSKLEFLFFSFFSILPYIEAQGPFGSVDKPFLWTEGRVCLKASLNKSAYTHGENVNITIDVKNDSRKIVRKIRVSFNLFKKVPPPRQSFTSRLLAYLCSPPTSAAMLPRKEFRVFV